MIKYGKAHKKTSVLWRKRFRIHGYVAAPQKNFKGLWEIEGCVLKFFKNLAQRFKFYPMIPLSGHRQFCLKVLPSAKFMFLYASSLGPNLDQKWRGVGKVLMTATHDKVYSYKYPV